MSIIAILNPKGGCGKTTLTTNLARAFFELGDKVLVVDTDPQGSARDWHAAQEENPIDVIALDRPENLKSLATLAQSYQTVLIDGTAKHEESLGAAIKVADVVLIPVQPSPYDLWAVTDLVDFVKVRRDLTDGKPHAAFVITRAVSGTTLGKDITGALSDFELQTLETHIFQRQIYPQTASEGLTVFDSTNPAAKAEMSALANEVKQLMNGKGSK